MAIDTAELTRRFVRQEITDEKLIEVDQLIHNTGLNFALFLADNVPESRELSLAFTKIEEAVSHASAALARHS